MASSVGTTVARGRVGPGIHTLVRDDGSWSDAPWSLGFCIGSHLALFLVGQSLLPERGRNPRPRSSRAGNTSLLFSALRSPDSGHVQLCEVER
jgi:hypothetical protein